MSHTKLTLLRFALLVLVGCGGGNKREKTDTTYTGIKFGSMGRLGDTTQMPLDSTAIINHSELKP